MSILRDEDFWRQIIASTYVKSAWRDVTEPIYAKDMTGIRTEIGSITYVLVCIYIKVGEEQLCIARDVDWPTARQVQTLAVRIICDVMRLLHHSHPTMLDLRPYFREAP